MATCLLGLGSNLGDPTQTMHRAIRELATHAGKLLAQSRLHPTSPIGGPPGQTDYLNAAILLETSFAPEQLLNHLHQVESQFGRQRTQRWGPRTLDLDLLLFDQLIVDSPSLTIPHPRLPFRRFVLEPAVEIAAEWLHAPTQFTLLEMLSRLDRKPVHISVLGQNASQVARAAAAKLNAVYFNRPSFVPRDPGESAGTLESLQHAAQQWNSMVVQRGVDVVISDFWVGEARTAANENQLSDAELHSEAVGLELPPTFIHPHLVICREPMDPIAGASPEQWRQSVLAPRQFPVLTLTNADDSAVVAEVTAAVEAIKS